MKKDTSKTATSEFARRRLAKQAEPVAEVAALPPVEPEPPTGPEVIPAPSRPAPRPNRGLSPTPPKEDDSTVPVASAPSPEDREPSRRKIRPQKKLPKWLGPAVASCVLVLAALAVGVGYWFYSTNAGSERVPATPTAAPGDAPAEALWGTVPPAEFFSLSEDSTTRLTPEEIRQKRIEQIRSFNSLPPEEREVILADAVTQALLRPRDPAVQHHAGVLSDKAGDFEQARLYFQKAIALAPTSMTGYFNLGMVEFKLGNYPETIANLEKYLEFDSDHPIAIYRLALSKALTRQPLDDLPPLPDSESQAGVYTRAVIAFAQGQTEASTELADQARLLAPHRASNYEADLRLLGLRGPEETATGH